MTERSTKKQRELLTFVDNFIQGHGYGPSYREVMRGMGYKSVSTVATHIDGLIAKGYLHKRDNSARSLEVVTTRLTSGEVHHKPTTSQEKWLVTNITDRFKNYEQTHSTEVLDELYVLIGSLKVLGLTDAYEAMKQKLSELK